MQNISGPGVAVSSRGINIAQTPKRRAIDPAIPAATAYAGPWACRLEDNTIKTAVNETGNDLSIHTVCFGSMVERIASELQFNATTDITGTALQYMYCFLELRFHYVDNLGAASQFRIAQSRLTLGFRPGDDTVYPDGYRPFSKPFEVGQVFNIPLCKVKFTAGTNTISSIEQMQYGPITIQPIRANVAYSGSKLFWFVVNNRPNFQSGILGFERREIAIPKNSTQLSVWCDPTQATDPLTLTPVQPEGFIVAVISTDHNGLIESLWDTTNAMPYNQDDLTDNIITDTHNSLPSCRHLRQLIYTHL
jgi:hypothetical protein